MTALISAGKPPRKDPKRARIGLIIPSSNRIIESELVPAFPESVGVHVARVRVRGVSVEDLLPSISQAADLLSDANCRVIAFHCTASCMENGVEVNNRIMELIQKASGRIARTTGSAMIAAVNALGIRDLVLLTPYSEATTVRQRSFLNDIGLNVISTHYRDLNKSPDYCYIAPEYWFQELIRTADARAQGYLLSCANVSCMEFIEQAEKTLGRPVLTSNQAVLWDTLRHAGIDDELEHIGALGKVAAPLPPQASNANTSVSV